MKPILNSEQIAEMLDREREAAKEGMLIGLCMAAVSGAGMMLFVLWLIGKVVA